MGIPSSGFGLAGAATSPAIYPVGSVSNNLQSTGFIPEIWSGKLVEKFYASTVLAAISNTDYEGEIRDKGDRVKIRTKPTITIRNYLSDGLLALDRPTVFGRKPAWQIHLQQVNLQSGQLLTHEVWADCGWNYRQPMVASARRQAGA